MGSGGVPRTSAAIDAVLHKPVRSAQLLDLLTSELALMSEALDEVLPSR